MYDYYLNLPGGSWQKTQVQVMTARKINSQIQWIKLAQAEAICCLDSYDQTSTNLTASGFIDSGLSKKCFPLLVWFNVGKVIYLACPFLNDGE